MRPGAALLWLEAPLLMQSDFEATEARLAEISTEGPATYPFAGGRVHQQSRARRHSDQPSCLLRYRFLKRAIDLILIAVSAPLLLPALLIVAAIVRFDSPGPVFFSHRRILRGGAFFSMWKFRTMCVNSSEVLEQYLSQHPKARAEWSRTHKLRSDPRVTSVGTFLRRYSLDELPQAWNVITGRMSLVGPRPIVAAEVEKYGRYFECYCRAKPGVTGLWQVSGRSKLSYEARVKLDCKYVEEWSLWADVKILFATLKSVVNQDGAY